MAVKMVIRVCFVVSLVLVMALAACKSEKAAPSASPTPEGPSATPASAATSPATGPAGTPTVAPAPTTASPRPSLTSEQQEEILDIAARDANVQRVIQGLSISNTRLVVWANGQGVLIGASVAMSLEQPATVEGEWRGISWMDSSKTKYGVTVYNAKLSNVKTVDVWVDLGKRAVVGWSANSDAKVETGSVIIATPAAQ